MAEPEPIPLRFLTGGGQMGALMRSHDWSATALGPPEQWPQALRTAVRLMLNTGHPMCILWGAESIWLYNDAFSTSIGPERHPVSLGTPGHEVWQEVWHVIGPEIEQVLSGACATWHVNQLVPITRHGRVEQVYWTYSYSPIDDETALGGVGGILVLCTETTQEVAREHVLVEDTEKLEQSRLQLEAERARLQTIVDTIPTGLIIINETGAFELENAEWKRTWAGNGVVAGVVDYDSYKGFRPDTGERISNEEWPCAVSLMQGIPTRDVVLDIERFDGTRGTIVVSSAPVRDQTGRVVAAVAANMDISELRSTQQKLEEADRRKDEFLAMLAHELRNPLAPIGAAAQLLQVANLDGERVRRISDVIGRQVGHMTGLIDDLLDVSRVTRGMIELEKKLLDIRQIVNEAAEQVNPLVQARRQQLSLHLAGNSLKVHGDEKRLVQVIGNLLNNAAKYTREGGSILVETELQDAHVLIEISDNGIGMTAELVEHAFDLFTQAERTSDRASGGLGLGLALVKKLVQLHDGEVSCKSAGLNKGSTFSIRLPRWMEEAHHSARQDSEDTISMQAHGLRILIADDNVDAAAMLSMLLETTGHEVLVEHDPYRALERARVDAPQVCILDIGLPEMDGNELARRLRSHPETAKVKLIALTGYGQENDREKSLAAGFDHHLVKPVDTAKLAGILKQVASA